MHPPEIDCLEITACTLRISKHTSALSHVAMQTSGLLLSCESATQAHQMSPAPFSVGLLILLHTFPCPAFTSLVTHLLHWVFSPHSVPDPISPLSPLFLSLKQGIQIHKVSRSSLFTNQPQQAQMASFSPSKQAQVRLPPFPCKISPIFSLQFFPSPILFRDFRLTPARPSFSLHSLSIFNLFG